MDIIKIQRLLKNSFTCKSWLDVIPENARYPAISYKHQSHSAARLLSGKKSGRSDQWTAEIVTKKDDDIKKLVDEAELLHNTRTDDYLRVMITIGNVGVQLKDEKLRSTLLTIQTYEA